MATTLAEVAERTFRTVAMGRSQAAARLYKRDIEAMVAPAVQELADDVRASRRGSPADLQKAYTPTLTNGVASLATSTDLLLQSVPFALVTHSTLTWPLSWVPSERDLYYATQDQFVLYTVARQALYTRNTDGSRTSLTGGILTIVGAFVPVVAATAGSTTLPVQLEDDLLEILCRMAREKMGAAAAPAGA